MLIQSNFFDIDYDLKELYTFMHKIYVSGEVIYKWTSYEIVEFMYFWGTLDGTDISKGMTRYHFFLWFKLWLPKIAMICGWVWVLTGSTTCLERSFNDGTLRKMIAQYLLMKGVGHSDIKGVGGIFSSFILQVLELWEGSASMLPYVCYSDYYFPTREIDWCSWCFRPRFILW